MNCLWLSKFKGLFASLLLVAMVFITIDGVISQTLGKHYAYEFSDIDGAEKDSEKEESEKKEKESESEDFLIAIIKKQRLDFLRISSLFKNYYAQWCDPELRIITPPPEVLG